jgi:dTDP-4-dehydrorhamnose reductase
VLWERTAPDGVGSARWEWADRRLSRLRELGIRPVLGLVHHGSGPRDTSLIDPEFPEKLARYARAVAERFPWVKEWTPINEPLTTARFSTLYGIWYPHSRSFADFVTAVINQCRGITLAMAEIRQVVPDAQLVQTEDFGRISSTHARAERARMDQRLRLLSLDLLTGQVTPTHPLWADLVRAGARERDLWGLAEAHAVPDVVGVNYYVTSDRFLDDRLDSYPPTLHGGDGRQRYADVESVRVADASLTGHGPLLGEVWRRYRRPLAITEVYLSCTRDEQLRWFAEAWTGAGAARARGIDVRAVTAWSLMGSVGWDRLAVDSHGKYEPGVFDRRARSPRPTAVANMVRALAHGQPYRSPAFQSQGWWRRPERVLFPAQVSAGPPSPLRLQDQGRPLLVTGASGTLGQAIGRVAAQRGLAVVMLTHRDLDITDHRAVEQAIQAARPWAVVNAAGYVRVDEAEQDAERCWRDNVIGAETVARAARDHGARIATFSSDLVFDGRADAPYQEEATPHPLNVYGRTKAAADERVLADFPEALVFRTAAFFDPWDRHNFVAAALSALAAGVPFKAASDLWVSPTYVPDLAETVLDLLLDEAEGLWHVANQGAVTWADLAQCAVTAAGLHASAHLIEPTCAAALGLAAPRPAFSVLGTSRGQILGPFEDAIARFVAAAAPHACQTTTAGPADADGRHDSALQVTAPTNSAGEPDYRIRRRRWNRSA